MAGIWNVNGTYNSNIKKLTGKLTFQVGESFSARIISRSDNKNGISIKTLDGWEFSAELEEEFKSMPEKLIRFQVVDYMAGKIKLRIIPDNKEEDITSKESLIEILKENGLGEKDIKLLKSMIKFSVPLTRENISDIKSITEFAQKVNENFESAESFILKYLAKNNIEEYSPKGIEVKNLLRDYFNLLKTLTTEDILTMKENNIELLKENIESYNRIVKEFNGIGTSIDEIRNSLVRFLELFDTSKENKGNMSFIQNEFEEKIDYIKNTINSLVRLQTENNNDTLNSIMNDVKSSINDLKVYNALSENYYCMSASVKFNNHNYPCRLIVKDERKKGKKIDSTNTNLAISIITANLGVVDSYIKVRGNNLKIDLRCEEEWLRVFYLGKEKLIKNILKSGYNIEVEINKREESFDVSKCRDFFQDNNVNNINVIV